MNGVPPEGAGVYQEELDLGPYVNTSAATVTDTFSIERHLPRLPHHGPAPPGCPRLRLPRPWHPHPQGIFLDDGIMKKRD